MLAFQAAALVEVTARWSREFTVTDDNPSKQVSAAALDPQFRKWKFLTPEERLSIQNKVQALTLQTMDGSTTVKNQCTSWNEGATTQAEGTPKRSVSALDSLLSHSRC